MQPSMTKHVLFFSFIFSLLITLFFQFYSPLLVPIGISLFLSFLLSPLVDRLERKKIPRAVSSLILIKMTLLFLTLISFRLLPYLYHESLYFISMIPQALKVIDEKWLPALRELVLSTNLVDGVAFDKAIESFGDLSSLSTRAYSTLNTVWQTVPKLIGTVVNIVLIPLITFFSLVNMPKLKKNALILIPYTLREHVSELTKKLSTTLRSLLKGQALVALSVGILYSISFYVIGLESGIVIGIITGVARMVPYLDLIVGGTLSLIVVFSNFTSWTDLIPVSLVFLIIGSLDGMLIAPRILGRQAGLHPLVVILSLLSFASLYGFWGFVLAIPAIAVFKDLVTFLLPYYYRSSFYKKFNS